MKRSIVLVIIPLAAAAAGFFLPRQHPPPNIGFADTDTLLAADPAPGASLDLAKSQEAIRDQISRKNKPLKKTSDPLADLKSTNSTALSNKIDLLSSSLEHRMRASLRLNSEAETANLNDWLEKEYSEILAELDSLASQTTEADDPAGSQLRYRLLNLKLQWKVLTRDPLTLSKSREDELGRKIKKLEKQVSDRKKNLRQKQMEIYEEGARSLNAEVERRYRQKKKSLEEKLDSALAALEEEVGKELENARLETAEATKKGSALRRKIARLLHPAAPTNAPPVTGPARIRRKQLLAKLSLKAAEVCPEHGIDLLLAKPIWAGRKITDYTTLLSDARKK